MTKEEWKQVKEASESLFRQAKLSVDGYELTIRLERITQYKNAIMIYVNGSFKGKWLLEDCEERRRFLCPRNRSLLKGKDKEAMLKGLSKKRKAEFESINKFVNYYPYWTSFNSLKKHLIANNENIELVEII